MQTKLLLSIIVSNQFSLAAVNKFDLHMFLISLSSMFDQMTLCAIFEYLFDNILSIDLISTSWKKNSVFIVIA